MDTSKDYYQILGILPSAEDVLIKAAYRALSRAYHPDRNSSPDAEERMYEINEAYSILSDLEKRAAYDSIRKEYSGTAESHDFREDPEPENPPENPDWDIAVKFYPDLKAISHNLKMLSWRLESSYRAYLLKTKQYEHRREIANQLELEYLQRYFGKNNRIINFARDLIVSGDKKAAQELNNAVRVLGSDIDPSIVISKITRAPKEKSQFISEFFENIRNGTPQSEGAFFKIIELCGGSIKLKGLIIQRYHVQYKGRSYILRDIDELRNWAFENLF